MPNEIQILDEIRMLDKVQILEIFLFTLIIHRCKDVYKRQMRTNQVQYAVPMHCWGEYDIMKRMKEHPCSETYRNRIVTYDHRGEMFPLGGD